MKTVLTAAIGSGGDGVSIELFEVHCTEEQYRDGEHYDAAKNLTDLDDVIICDEFEPIFRHLMNVHVKEKVTL